VEILTTDLSGQLPVEETIDSVLVRRVPAFPADRDWRFAPGLTRAIRGNWDVVHCQGYHTFVAPIALAAAWRAGIPSMVTFHSGGPTSRLRGATRSMQMLALRPLVRHARALVAVSEFERRSLSAALHVSARRFVVVPNGSELPRPRPQGQRRDGEVLLVSVGRLVRYKGHHRVLAAMPTVLAHRPNAALQIIGSGPEEPELRRMVTELGLDSHVTIRSIPGNDRQAMADLLGQADLVTVLSEYESQGIAALEAITLGCKVLVADSSALSELAARGIARAVAPNASPADTAQAILAALDAPRPPAELRPWTWDDCAEGLADLYHRVGVES
jgi:glycosyltransferase involved in cell wall biosynthesis